MNTVPKINEKKSSTKIFDWNDFPNVGKEDVERVAKIAALFEELKEAIEEVNCVLEGWTAQLTSSNKSVN